VLRSPTVCDVSECDLETSITRRPRPTRTVVHLGGGGPGWVVGLPNSPI